MTWEIPAKQKIAERQTRLPSKWLIPEEDLPGDDILDVSKLCHQNDWLTPTELAITKLTVTQLAKAIVDRNFTSVQIVEAYAHRATIAQQLLNPLTEINFEQALAEAARLDAYQAMTGETVGPLHGVPISVKDMYQVKGLDTTIGYCSRVGQIAEKNGVFVGTLCKAGAVILTKTNVAQTMALYETINNVWGRTLNPFNRNLTPGGSSGGESALVAFHGSAIGVGSDLGGSVRVPAANCGLYAIRPSRARLSYTGISDVYEGQEALLSTVGSLAHSPEDMALLCAAHLAAEPWKLDPHVLPLPWKETCEVLPKETLCFAIAWGDELVTPHPPVMRGLRNTVEALRNAGHLVVNWRGPIGVEACNTAVGSFLSASGQDIMKDIQASCEPMLPDVVEGLRFNTESQYESWQAQRKRQIHAQWFHDVWQATSSYSGTERPIDGLIMPTVAYVARKHCAGMPGRSKPARHSYSLVPAVLDLTSGVFPTGLVQDPAIDNVVQDFKPRTEIDEQINALYDDPEDWRNAPIGLQLIGQRLEEEKVIAMLGVIRDALAVANDLSK